MKVVEENFRQLLQKVLCLWRKQIFVYLDEDFAINGIRPKGVLAIRRIFSLVDMITKVSNSAKIRNRYNQVPHLTQDTNGKVTNSQKTPQTRAKRSALSQQVTTKHI